MMKKFLSLIAAFTFASLAASAADVWKMYTIQDKSNPTTKKEYTAETPVIPGDTVTFVVEVLNHGSAYNTTGVGQSAHGTSWGFVNQDGLDTLKDTFLPKISLSVGGRRDEASIVGVLAGVSDGYATALICEYVVKPGDLALPLKIWDNSFVVTPTIGGTTIGILNKDSEGKVDPAKPIIKPEWSAGWFEPAYNVDQLPGDLQEYSDSYNSTERRNKDLALSNIHIKGVSFSDPAPEGNSAEGTWLSVRANSSELFSGDASVKVTGVSSSNGGASTLYIWSGDTNIVRVVGNDSALIHVGTAKTYTGEGDARTTTESPVYRLVFAQGVCRFKLYALDDTYNEENRNSAKIYVSAQPGMTLINDTTPNKDYIEATVDVIAPSKPSVKVRLDDNYERAVLINSESQPKMTLELSGRSFPQKVTINLAVTYKNEEGKYVAQSETAPEYLVIGSESVKETLEQVLSYEFEPGETRKELYYFLKGVPEGRNLMITPSCTKTDLFAKNDCVAAIMVATPDPKILSVDTKGFQSGLAHKGVTVTISDSYRNLDLKDKYQVNWYENSNDSAAVKDTAFTFKKGINEQATFTITGIKYELPGTYTSRVEVKTPEGVTVSQDVEIVVKERSLAKLVRADGTALKDPVGENGAEYKIVLSPNPGHSGDLYAYLKATDDESEKLIDTTVTTLPYALEKRAGYRINSKDGETEPFVIPFTDNGDVSVGIILSTSEAYNGKEDETYGTTTADLKVSNVAPYVGKFRVQPQGKKTWSSATAKAVVGKGYSYEANYTGALKEDEVYQLQAQITDVAADLEKEFIVEWRVLSEDGNVNGCFYTKATPDDNGYVWCPTIEELVWKGPHFVEVRALDKDQIKSLVTGNDAVEALTDDDNYDDLDETDPAKGKLYGDSLVAGEPPLFEEFGEATVGSRLGVTVTNKPEMKVTLDRYATNSEDGLYAGWYEGSEAREVTITLDQNVTGVKESKFDVEILPVDDTRTDVSDADFEIVGSKEYNKTTVTIAANKKTASFKLIAKNGNNKAKFKIVVKEQDRKPPEPGSEAPHIAETQFADGECQFAIFNRVPELTIAGSELLSDDNHDGVSTNAISVSVGQKITVKWAIKPESETDYNDWDGVKVTWTNSATGKAIVTDATPNTQGEGEISFAFKTPTAGDVTYQIRVNWKDESGVGGVRVWKFTVIPAKTLTLYPVGPSVGIGNKGRNANYLNMKYAGNGGLGEGKVWIEEKEEYTSDNVTIDGHDQTWVLGRPNTVKIYAEGYRFKDDKDEDDMPVKVFETNNQFQVEAKEGEDKKYKYTYGGYKDAFNRDSFFYTWLDVSLSATPAEGEEETITSTAAQILPDPAVLGTDTAVGYTPVDLPTAVGEDGNYPESRFEAIFSKEFYESDNLGDINQDEIPDWYVARYGFGIFTTNAVGEINGMIGDDTVNLAAYNKDLNADGEPSPDFLPKPGSTGAMSAAGVSNKWTSTGRAFTAKDEIRGYHYGLNRFRRSKDTPQGLKVPEFSPSDFDMDTAEWIAYSNAVGNILRDVGNAANSTELKFQMSNNMLEVVSNATLNATYAILDIAYPEMQNTAYATHEWEKATNNYEKVSSSLRPWFKARDEYPEDKIGNIPFEGIVYTDFVGTESDTMKRYESFYDFTTWTNALAKACDAITNDAEKDAALAEVRAKTRDDYTKELNTLVTDVRNVMTNFLRKYDVDKRVETIDSQIASLEEGNEELKAELEAEKAFLLEAKNTKWNTWSYAKKPGNGDETVYRFEVADPAFHKNSLVNVTNDIYRAYAPSRTSLYNAINTNELVEAAATYEPLKECSTTPIEHTPFDELDKAISDAMKSFISPSKNPVLGVATNQFAEITLANLTSLEDKIVESVATNMIDWANKSDLALYNEAAKLAKETARTNYLDIATNETAIAEARDQYVQDVKDEHATKVAEYEAAIAGFDPEEAYPGNPDAIPEDTFKEYYYLKYYFLDKKAEGGLTKPAALKNDNQLKKDATDAIIGEKKSFFEDIYKSATMNDEQKTLALFGENADESLKLNTPTREDFHETLDSIMAVVEDVKTNIKAKIRESVIAKGDAFEPEPESQQIYGGITLERLNDLRADLNVQNGAVSQISNQVYGVLYDALFWTPERPTSPMLEDTDGDGIPDGYEYWMWYRAHIGWMEERTYVNEEIGEKITVTNYCRLGMDTTEFDQFGVKNDFWDGKYDHSRPWYEQKHEFAKGGDNRGMKYDLVDPSDPNCTNHVVITSAEIERMYDPLVPLKGTNIDAIDTDGDGLPDLEEFELGTNPLHWDSDGDGLPDGWEVAVGLDPLNPRDTDAKSNNPDGDAMAFAQNVVHVLKFTHKDQDQIWLVPTLDMNGVTRVNGASGLYEIPAGHIIRAVKVDAVPETVKVGSDNVIALKPAQLKTKDLVFPGGQASYEVLAGALIHDQVYNFLGYDYRTAWYQPDATRRLRSTLPNHDDNAYSTTARNTRAYTTLDEFNYYEYCTRVCGKQPEGKTSLERLLSLTTYPSDVRNGEGEVIHWGADSDGDGVPDGWECYVGSNPLDGKSGARDDDGDGLSLAQEFSGTYSSTWYPNTPTVANRVPLSWPNKFYPTDPGDRDTDGDGLSDYEEMNQFAYAFIRYSASSNLGSVSTTEEGELVATPENGTATTPWEELNKNLRAQWHNSCFLGGGLNPCSMDTDLDGLPDAWESQYRGNPVECHNGKIYSPASFRITYLGYYNDPAAQIADGFPGDGTFPTLSEGDRFIIRGMDGTLSNDGRRTLQTQLVAQELDPVTKTIRDFDFDHDGLDNYQEYLVQALRHFRYDDAETPLMGHAIIWKGDDAAAKDDVLTDPANIELSKALSTVGKIESAFPQFNAVDAEDLQRAIMGLPEKIVSSADGSVKNPLNEYKPIDISPFWAAVTNNNDYTAGYFVPSLSVPIIETEEITSLVPVTKTEKVEGVEVTVTNGWSVVTETKNTQIGVNRTELDRDPISIGMYDFAKLGYFTSAKAKGDQVGSMKYMLMPHTLKRLFTHSTKGTGYNDDYELTQYLDDPSGFGALRIKADAYCSCDPTKADTDGDGMDDYWELFHGLNPLLGEVDVIGEAYNAKKIRTAGAGISAFNNAWVFAHEADNLILDGTTGFGDGDEEAEEDDNNEDVEDEIADAELPEDVTIVETVKRRSLTKYLLPLDPIKYPWIMGQATVDADGDGLRNFEEAPIGNQANPRQYHSDPTPRWMTDTEGLFSYTRQYYSLKALGGDWFNTWTTGNNTYNLHGLKSTSGEDYMFAFEVNEGYDTDGDFKSDSQELVSTYEPASDPLDVTDPARRQAMYFPGTNSTGVASAMITRDQSSASVYRSGDVFRKFTVECWINPDKLKAGEEVTDQVILERTHWYDRATLINFEGHYRANFRLGITKNDKNEDCIYALFDNSDATESASAIGSTSLRVMAPSAVEYGKWTHIAATYDGVWFTLYLNGAEAERIPASKNGGVALIPANGIKSISEKVDISTGGGSYYPNPDITMNEGFFVIGAQIADKWHEFSEALHNPKLAADPDLAPEVMKNAYRGYVDEVRMWDGARSAEEIYSNYDVHFGREQVEANRKAVYLAWDKGLSRNENVGKGELPAELLVNLGFETIPASDKPSKVMRTPDGFQEKVLGVVGYGFDPRKINNADAEWTDEELNAVLTTYKNLTVGWYKEFRNAGIGSTVYTDYVLPRARNTVAQLAPLSGRFMDTIYWGEYLSAYWMAKEDHKLDDYAIPNSMNPYSEMVYTDDALKSLFKLWQYHRRGALVEMAYNISGHGDNFDALALIEKSQFDARARFSSSTDFYPIGGAYAKTSDTFWDDAGAVSDWSDKSQAGDLDKDGVDDYWAEVYSVDATRPQLDTDKDGIPDAWERSHGLDPKSADDAEEYDQNDVMAYEEAEMYLVKIAGKSYITDTLATVGDAPSAGALFWATYYYGTAEDNLYALGTPATPSAKITEIMPVRVAIIHNQVYNKHTPKFNAKTANPTIPENARVNTKPFTALDKYLASVYGESHGMSIALTPHDNDADNDGMPDGWELYVGLNPNRFDDRTSDTDKDGLEAIKEYNGGKVTDPNTPNSIYTDISDKVVYQYNLTDAEADDDGDGLSNYAEYVITEVLKLKTLDPKNANSLSKDVSDYFLKVGDLYLGEIFTDHDQMNDVWEGGYDLSKVSRYIYDPSEDPELDGWSNYAEFRAKTDPTSFASKGFFGNNKVEYPVPSIELSVVTEDPISSTSAFVVQAKRSDLPAEKDDGGYEATWFVGGVPAEETENAVSFKHSRDTSTDDAAVKPYTHVIGRYIDGTQTIHLSPGSITPGSVNIYVYDPDFKIVDTVTGRTSGYVGHVEWCKAMVDVDGKFVRNEKTVGTIDYDSGTVTLNYRNLGENITYLNNIVTGEHEVYEEGELVHCYETTVKYKNCYFGIEWMAEPITGGNHNTYYLTDTSTGHICEGKNDFIVFLDQDGDGKYTVGEPFGAVNDVDVGWDSAKLSVKLTKTNPRFPRFDILSGDNDRDYWYGKPVDPSATNIVNEVVGAGGHLIRVRVVRYSVDDRELPEAAKTTLFDKYINIDKRNFIHEGDILKAGEFDLDWSNANAIFTPGTDVGKVKYVVVTGENGETTNSTAIVRYYDTSAADGRKTATNLKDVHCYSSRPTFSWMMRPARDNIEFNTYTAFSIKIMKDGEAIYDSGYQKMPSSDSNGYYNWTAPVSFGDIALGSEGYSVLPYTGEFKWRISIYNSKFKSDALFAEANLTVAVDETGKYVDGHGYGALDVNVKYAGPALVVEELLTSADEFDGYAPEGQIRVEAYETPDFSGDAVASAFALKHGSEIKAKVCGLEIGKAYYLRAYIDSDGDQKKSDWESWGCTTDPVTVAVAPVAVSFYVEDCDTDHDWLPDAWEYAKEGNLTKLGGDNEKSIKTSDGLASLGLQSKAKTAMLSSQKFLVAPSAQTFATESFASLLLGAPITVVDGQINGQVVENSLVITGFAIDGNEITLTLDAAVGVDANNALSSLYDIADATAVTVEVLFTTDLANGWNVAAKANATIGKEAQTITFTLPEKLSTSGFYKLQIKQ